MTTVALGSLWVNKKLGLVSARPIHNLDYEGERYIVFESMANDKFVKLEIMKRSEFVHKYKHPDPLEPPE